MRTPVRALGLLALALAPAPAAIWPDQIPPFFRKSAEPQALKGDAALWEEYGFDEGERAVYEAGAKRYSTTAWRFRDPTGAMAAYQTLRPEGSAPADIVQLGVTFPDGFLMAYGNYVLRWDDRVPTEPELRFVFERLPRLDQGPRPGFIDTVPSPGRVANSERYLMGPVSLEKFEPRIPPASAGFHQGAEAQLVRFDVDGQKLVLLLFSYPTPHIARDRQAEFQKISGALVKRAGPLVAAVMPPADPNAAERILAGIRYQASISWDESTKDKSELQKFGEFILNVFIFIGLLLAFAVLSGAAVTGIRWLAGRRSGKDRAQETMILLDLREK